MPANHSKRAIAVTAMAQDGTGYRIERRAHSLPGDKAEDAFLYCCIPDGQPVGWLGYGRYQLPDGTIVQIPVTRPA
ncbi:hypothetical protein [Achromobacter denitrificans]|uniref:hypothetical protein n=1 Tax=Achromobacter denitrificans TaxID=32002 RepID=UPI000F68DF49|nr:hypothetical protein [Achromobacter denitrificans]